MSQFLVGNDVRAYSIQGNGWDLYPGINGTNYAMIGMYKELELSITFTDSDVTPTSQMLEQSRMTGYTWDITAKHLVPYADANPPGLDLIFNGNSNVLLIFQLCDTGNNTGPYYSAYGRIKTDVLAVTRESVMETLSIKNAGPIGTSGASLFVGFGTPVTVSQAQVLVTNSRQATTTALTF